MPFYRSSFPIDLSMGSPIFQWDKAKCCDCYFLQECLHQNKVNNLSLGYYNKIEPLPLCTMQGLRGSAAETSISVAADASSFKRQTVN